MNHALVNPNILAWSRSRAGLSAADLAARLPAKLDKVLAWEAGESRPTFRQAQQWASLAHIPFGYLFLTSPPPAALPLPDLRTVGSLVATPPSIDLQDTVRDVLRKQAWYADYLKTQEQAPLPFIGKFSGNADVAAVVADMRAVLNLPAIAPHRGSDDALRQLIEAADAAGILVMRSGMVGSNTRRKLDVAEFRGFAISDPLAPVVFINLADAPSARLFTLLHELAHLWLGSSGISSVAPANQRREEAFCNRVAGEFLVPLAQLMPLWQSNGDWQQQLPVLASRFSVSKLVIVRRACDLGLLSNDAFSQYYLAELDAWRSQKGGGGSFYRTAKAKNSLRFSRAVVAEALSGRLLLRDAGTLLGVAPAKITTYAKRLDE